MNEQQWQANVIELCKYLGYIVYHTHDSRRSEPGFPDLVIVGNNRCLFRELKTENGEVTSAQLMWGGALIAAGMDWSIWRPSDIEQVKKELEKNG